MTSWTTQPQRPGSLLESTQQLQTRLVLATMNMDNIKDDPERVLSWVPSSPDIDKGNHQSCSLCPLTEISLRSTWMLLTSRLIDRCPQDPMEPDA